ncbi:MAG: acyltransferase family protein [Hyphomicrobiales bacterium]
MKGAAPANRIDWVDYAKGFCIVMVVMMHSTLGVEQAAGREGWMHAAVAFAKPFRMPDFFLISGLFLARVIDRDWRDYLDKKVVHFAYFYVLWVTIQFAFKAPMFASEMGWRGVGFAYVEAFIEPFGTLWFIYLLPIFFVAVKLTRNVPWPVVWLVGAALEIAHISTGWTVIDEFTSRFVYFYTGYIFATRIFALAARVQDKPMQALGALAVWAIFNGMLVMGGYGDRPFVSLGLGLVCAGAVVTVAALIAMSDVFKPLRYCGQNSIVIYLAFFLPMALTRMVLLKTGIITDLGTVSLLVTAAGVMGALVWYWSVRGTPLRILFERPAWARLKSARGPVLQPAE